MITTAKSPIFPAVLSRSDRKGLYPTSRHLKTPTQNRKLWRGASPMQENYNYRGPRRTKIYRRFELIRMWRRPPYRWPAQIYSPHHRCWDWGKCWERFKPNIPEHKRGKYAQTHFWADEGARIQKIIAQIKKEIEIDPYGALFGRRLEPFSALNRFEDTCASLYRSLFGLDKHENTPSNTGSKDTKARPKPPNNDSANHPESNNSSSREPRDGIDAESPPKSNISRYEFDPISGRMVLKKPRFNDTITKKGPIDEGSTNKATNDPERHTTRTGFLSFVNRPGINSRVAPKGNITSTSSDSSPIDPKPGKKLESRSGSEESPGSSCKSTIELSGPPQPDNRLVDAIEVPEKEIDCYGSSSELSSDTGYAKKVETTGSSNAGFQDELPPDGSTYNHIRHLEVNSRDAKEKAEDLDLLQASDIRSHYDLGKFNRDSKMQGQMKKESDRASDSLADQTSNVDIQDAHKRTETHKQEQCLGAAPSKRSILSQETPNDTAESQHQEKVNNTRQHPPSNSQFAETYRVLAYDPSTLQITHAEAGTSLHRINESDHPSEILSRLDNPAKFLPYFEKMHADGYEISSGGGDILVFRKPFKGHESTGPSLVQLANEAQEIKAQLRNEPLLDEESIKDPNSASDQHPTRGIYDGGPADLARPARLEEGSLWRSKTDPTNKSTIGSSARRMFISGAATAATCYAIGVVIEYFRTGGEDGLGIDAFTEFESERRRRDMDKTG